MRVFMGITVLIFLAGNGFGQRGGMGGGFGRGAGGSFRGGIGRFRGGLRGFRSGFRRGFRASRLDGNGFSGYGLGYGDYYGDYYGDVVFAPETAESARRPRIVTPMAAQLPEPPLPPPTGVILEYHWPDSDQGNTDGVFSIVTNDGAIHRAKMLWVDGDFLRFTTETNHSDQLLRSSIARDPTDKANAGKNIKAWLP